MRRSPNWPGAMKRRADAVRSVYTTALHHRREIGLGVGAVALLLALLAGFFAVSNLVFQVRADSASGSVRDLAPIKNADGSVQVPVRYTAHVVFVDAAGARHEFENARAMSDPPAIGDDVPVLYQRENPQQARIANYLQMYREAIVLGVWALIAGILAEELLRRHEPRAPVGGA